MPRSELKPASHQAAPPASGSVATRFAVVAVAVFSFAACVVQFVAWDEALVMRIGVCLALVLCVVAWCGWERWRRPAGPGPGRAALARGHEHVLAGRMEQARTAFGLALGEFTQRHDDLGAADALFATADLDRLLGRVTDAERGLKAASERYERLDAPLGKAAVLRAHADIYLLRGSIAEARRRVGQGVTCY